MAYPFVNIQVQCDPCSYPPSVVGWWTVVRIVDGEITVGPERVGPSAALGGHEPTLGDALIVLGHASYGDAELATQSLQQLAHLLQANEKQGECEDALGAP